MLFIENAVLFQVDPRRVYVPDTYVNKLKEKPSDTAKVARQRTNDHTLESSLALFYKTERSAVNSTVKSSSKKQVRQSPLNIAFRRICCLLQNKSKIRK